MKERKTDFIVKNVFITKVVISVDRAQLTTCN